MRRCWDPAEGERLCEEVVVSVMQECVDGGDAERCASYRDL